MSRYRRSQIQRIAVGYVRRSTDRQEQSIADQRIALERYADSQGLTLSRFYTDDAISGTSAKRPAFQEMIADSARAPRPFTHVLVYDVKRFGRLDNDEAGYYRFLLRSNGVEVLYSSENFSGDGTDDLLRPVKQWQAREESRDLSKVTIRGLLSKVTGGCWLGRTPPYGYDLRYRSDLPPKVSFSSCSAKRAASRPRDHGGVIAIRNVNRALKVSAGRIPWNPFYIERLVDRLL